MTSLELMQSLYTELSQKMTEHGFAPVFPEGIRQNELPLAKRSNDSCYIDYVGKKGKLRLLYSDNKVYILAAADDANSVDDTDYSKIATVLFILEEYDSRDVRSTVNELNETLEENFGIKDIFKKTNGQKKPQVVTRNQAKSGALSYDGNTLAVKLLALYPELKDAYNENVESYGEFLQEDFLVNHANAPILSTIKSNHAPSMKKLFNILCEIYDSGTNSVQNLIAVTILGSIKNDPTMITNILPYLSDSMLEPVIEVNKILATSKSANARLENPPPYKPKNKKSGGLMQSLMGGGTPQ